jgi:dTDP-4-amino-4,6-dideoxygalactose transaminase
MAAHMEPAYTDYQPSLPVTERLTQHSLILPLFHQMTPSEQEQVVSVVTSALTSSRPAMSVP